MEKKLIGIDLGGTTTKFAILSLDGEIQQKWSIETDIFDNGIHILPNIIESINHRLNLYNMSPEEFIGVGIGSPGSVDINAGTVIGAFNLNWVDLQPVQEQVEAGTGIKCSIDNDANVAALGEGWKGAGENDSDVIFITLGTGVGGGIIVGGRLLHGVSGCAGEIGHINIDPNGFKCSCGNRGCLETVSSATGVVRLARHLSEEFAGESKLKEMLDDGREITSKDVFEYAERGDSFALMVVDKVCFYLGIACGSLGNTLNPSSIILGGGVSAAGEFLRTRVEKYFEKFSFPQVADTTKIKLAKIGNEAGVVGAASLVLQRIFSVM